MLLKMSDASVVSVSEDLRSIFSKGTIERARRARNNIENYYRWDGFILFTLIQNSIFPETWGANSRREARDCGD